MKDGLSGGKIETGRAVRCLALARGERMVAWVSGMLLNKLRHCQVQDPFLC